MAAHAGRLLRQWPMWQQHCCSNAAFHHLIFSPLLPVTTRTNSRRPSLTTVHLATRGVHKLLRGLRQSDYKRRQHRQFGFRFGFGCSHVQEPQ
ncbi:hypothetical protein COP2_043662 [Malus domestica]